jgi:hypothetical protein
MSPVDLYVRHECWIRRRVTTLVSDADGRQDCAVLGLCLYPGDPAGRSPTKERRANEHVDHGRTGDRLKSPQTSSLPRRQLKPRHLDELATNPIGDGVKLHRGHGNTSFNTLNCSRLDCVAEWNSKGRSSNPAEPAAVLPLAQRYFLF